MTDLDELHARVVADFDDVATRAVYADALTLAGDPRGELISICCALELAGAPTLDALIDGPLAGEELARCCALHRRANQIVLAHDLPAHTRGFVTAVEMDAFEGEELVALAALLERTPVQTLELSTKVDAIPAIRRMRLAGVRRLIARAELLPILEDMPRVRILEVDGAASDARLASLDGPEIVELVAEIGSPSALDALARGPLAPRLRRLDLRAPLDAPRIDVVAILDGRFPALAELGVSHATLDGARLAELPLANIPTSLSLQLQQLAASTAAVLAAAPRLRRLEVTSLASGAIAELARARGLAGLWIGEVGALANVVIETIATSRLVLRRFRIGAGPVDDALARAIATATAFAGVRHVQLMRAALSDGAVRSLLALRDLVELELQENVVRIPDELVREHPTLVSIAGTGVHDEATQDALRAHLGTGCRARHRTCLLFVGSPIDPASLMQLAIPEVRLERSRRTVVAYADQTTVSIQTSDTYGRERAAARAHTRDPALARRVAAYSYCIQFSAASTIRAEVFRAIVQAVAASVGPGILWDDATDTLVAT